MESRYEGSWKLSFACYFKVRGSTAKHAATSVLHVALAKEIHVPYFETLMLLNYY